MASISPAENVVVRIEIFTRWLGFADPPMHSAKLVISRKTEGFSRENLPDGVVDAIPGDRVARLLDSLARPVVPELDPSLFDVPAAVIINHYGSCWTDDYPSHLVKVRFASGSVTTIVTDHQQTCMLPLKVSFSSGATGFETFDPRLSRAIAALMPDDYLDKGRLDGQSGMLHWDLRRYLEAGGAANEAPTVAEPRAEVPVFSPEEQPELTETTPLPMDDLFELLLNLDQESPEEKAEAEQTGNLSKRLLKKIALDEVRELLSSGANPSVADDAGQSALMLAAFPPVDAERFRVLAEAGADVTARRKNDGLTGLHLACSGGMADAAQLWIEAGSDVNATSPGGGTPLMYSVNWPAIVRMLLDAGADVHAVDQDGDSALVYAIVYQRGIASGPQIEVFRALIAAGSDVNERNLAGLTPLGQARKILARERVNAEVSIAMDGKPEQPHPGYWNDLRQAEAIVNVILEAGGSD